MKVTELSTKSIHKTNNPIIVRNTRYNLRRLKCHSDYKTNLLRRMI